MPNTLEVDMPALKARVTRILTDPKAEWPLIAAESTSIEQLYRTYIGPLAAIPAIAGFIGGSILAFGFFRTPIVTGLLWMGVTFVLTLVGVYVSAFIVDKLAPTFDSRPDMVQALKLTGYACTPAFLGGVFSIIPFLGILAIIPAVYGIYLFYLGLPVLMKTPQSKVIPYMAIAAIVSIVMMFVLFAIAGMFFGAALIFS
jgi:hypothetical protein